SAFLIPAFLILVGVKMMQIFTVNLWKWFFGMAISMIWLSLFLSKVLSPFMTEWVFNPGGNHGAIGVEYIENVIGPPGLTAVLFFSAIALLTFISKQTITWVRRIFNPLKSVANKASEIVTDKLNNSGSDADETEADDNNEPVSQTQQFANAVKSDNTKVAKTKEEDNAAPAVIDLTDLSNLGGSTKKKPAANAAEPIAPNVSNPAATNGAPASTLTVEVGKAERASGSDIAKDVFDTPINPLEPFVNYKHPGLELLSKDDNEGRPYVDMEEIKAHNEEIVRVLKSFGIEIREIKATVGPTITLYEITPAEGIRITKIRSLEDDIALRLSALGVRIIAPIPGKGTIGIEVPNKKRHNVSMESILNSRKFQETKFDLPIALGKTITNEVFMADLTKIPHLLVAGATGQGKSVGLNVIITSLLYKKHPNELKLVLIDPKKVEFSVYAPIADHFMAQVDDDDEPIITDVTKVVRTLKSLCTLMDHRYDLLKLAGARNLKEYNDKFLHHRLNPELGHEFMPYIVVIIDEFGDLIMTAGKEVEMPIARIAQLARAVGIHMIIATQRPTTSIITGNIKANFPGRIAFKVSSMMDSRIILDRPGANQLIGMGDMLYLNGNEPTRVQCAFINTPEIVKINEYIAKQSGPVHPMELPEPKGEDGGDTGSGSNAGDMGNLDPFFEEAARSVIISQQGSTSMIQRRFSIGYNRAGRLMDQLEKAGIVGAAHGSKPRDVLIADEGQLSTIMAQLKR
ncbi:DNA translocase FtsK, partial [Prevotella sp.]